MRVEVLILPGCGDGVRTVEEVTELARKHVPGVVVERIEVETAEDAERLMFPGSPTVRVNGLDIEPDPPTNFGIT